MASSAPSIVFGTSNIGRLDEGVFDEMLHVLDEHKITVLDTAYIYANSEDTIGAKGLPKKYTIQTKARGFAEHALSKANILASWEEQSKRLGGVESVDIYYFHAPDPSIPIEESLSAIQELYSAGKFKRFGLSNFLPEDVQKVHDIQKKAGSVLPSVFQGNYNAVSRHVETSLFPLLRKLNISFYAYSPIAGGFLVKDSAAIKAGTLGGRWSKDLPVGTMYNKMYGQPTLLDALDEWGHIASDAGITKAALAYRWTRYHSSLKGDKGDAVIVGASKVEQLKETLKVLEDGPLDEKTVQRVEAVWEKVKNEAPLDNYNSHAAKTK